MRAAVAKTVAACCGVDGVVASPALCRQLSALPRSLTVRGFADAALDCLDACYQAASGEQRSSRADSRTTHTASSSFGSIQGSNTHAKCGASQIQDHSFLSGLHQWRSVAQLSAADAEELLLQHPYLQSYLSSPLGFQPSTYYVNMAFLSLHPGELASQQHTALRAVLAVLPPTLLQSLTQMQPLRQVLQQQQPGHALHDMKRVLLNILGPLRPLQQQSLSNQVWQQQQQAHTLQAQVLQFCRQAHDPMMSRRQEMQQGLQQHSQFQASSHSFHHVAEAVITALGLPIDDFPSDDKLLARVKKAVQSDSRSSSSSRTISSNASTSASSSSGNTSSSSNSSTGSIGSISTGNLNSLSSSARFISTDVQALTSVNALARALEVTSRCRQLRNKLLHDTATVTQLTQDLRQSGGLNELEVLHLLLQRPLVLWQHATPELPGQLLSDFVQLLPDLGQSGRMAQLVLNNPRVLSCSSADLHALVDMLTTRLQMNALEASEIVQRHPELLWRPSRLMLANVGFLTGLGVTRSDLRQMTFKHPAWLTSSLRNLTVRWHCLQEVVKGSLLDAVLFPQLLTLSVTTCVGPRVAFAAQHNIRLLLPSGTHMAATDASTDTAQSPQQGKEVPLKAWLTAPERRMCRMSNLDLEDFKKFKKAWQEVHASYWERCSLKALPGSQQLRLSQHGQHN